jgi:hypothetical protein
MSIYSVVSLFFNESAGELLILLKNREALTSTIYRETKLATIIAAATATTKS